MLDYEIVTEKLATAIVHATAVVVRLEDESAEALVSNEDKARLLFSAKNMRYKTVHVSIHHLRLVFDGAEYDLYFPANYEWETVSDIAMCLQHEVAVNRKNCRFY